MSVALPPGIYSVRTSESTPRGLVNPSSDGAQFYVANVNTASLNQQFLINGIGTFTAMDTASFAYASLPSVVNAVVTRANTEEGWIINVQKNSNGTFTGPIMTKDTKKNYWGLNGNNVQLQDSAYNWTFVLL
ncbi:hypothetical protein K435DRAFT_970102 [Dendrothele bispora CBS 962.96]|uniref:Ricin B lectin domain-containing protein n=1 Tax=Dendrothele bispora (strain CBS 962.96) TaxID=1314807 RepID=A0A4S8LDL0_DENBC|nr:hypothetical protein K435DRAFT_971017 [Dendrothele bispora CBS 962.96]THU87002.1 hypothetical protein K435DRAFT_970102 [Dendrothele bispora CBS 962.96]